MGLENLVKLFIDDRVEVELVLEAAAAAADNAHAQVNLAKCRGTLAKLLFQFVLRRAELVGHFFDAGRTSEVRLQGLESRHQIGRHAGLLLLGDDLPDLAGGFFGNGNGHDWQSPFFGMSKQLARSFGPRLNKMSKLLTRSFGPRLNKLGHRVERTQTFYVA